MTERWDIDYAIVSDMRDANRLFDFRGNPRSVRHLTIFEETWHHSNKDLASRFLLFLATGNIKELSFAWHDFRFTHDVVWSRDCAIATAGNVNIKKISVELDLHNNLMPMRSSILQNIGNRPVHLTICREHLRELNPYALQHLRSSIQSVGNLIGISFAVDHESVVSSIFSALANRETSSLTSLDLWSLSNIAMPSLCNALHLPQLQNLNQLELSILHLNNPQANLFLTALSQNSTINFISICTPATMPVPTQHALVASLAQMPSLQRLELKRFNSMTDVRLAPLQQSMSLTELLIEDVAIDGADMESFLAGTQTLQTLKLPSFDTNEINNDNGFFHHLANGLQANSCLKSLELPRLYSLFNRHGNIIDLSPFNAVFAPSPTNRSSLKSLTIHGLYLPESLVSLLAVPNSTLETLAVTVSGTGIGRDEFDRLNYDVLYSAATIQNLALLKDLTLRGHFPSQHLATLLTVPDSSLERISFLMPHQVDNVLSEALKNATIQHLKTQDSLWNDESNNTLMALANASVKSIRYVSRNRLYDLDVQSFIARLQENLSIESFSVAVSEDFGFNITPDFQSQVDTVCFDHIIENRTNALENGPGRRRGYQPNGRQNDPFVQFLHQLSEVVGEMETKCPPSHKDRLREICDNYALNHLMKSDPQTLLRANWSIVFGNDDASVEPMVLETQPGAELY